MSETNSITIKGIVIPQHKTAADWENSNYKPAPGEKIVYDADDTIAYTRVKHGDGEKLAKDLPFTTDPTVQDWARQEDPPTGVYMGSDEEEIPDTCDVWIDPSQGVTSKVDYLSVLDITDQGTIDNFMINMPQYTTRNVLFSGSGISLGNTTIPQGSTGTITCGQNEAVLNLTTRNRVVYTGYWGRFGWKLELVKAGSLENIQVSSIDELDSLVGDFNNQNKTYVLQFVNDIRLSTSVDDDGIFLYKKIPSGTVGTLILNNYLDSGCCENILNLTQPNFSTWTITTYGTTEEGRFSDELQSVSKLRRIWQLEAGAKEANALKSYHIGDYNELVTLLQKRGRYNTYGFSTTKQDGPSPLQFPYIKHVDQQGNPTAWGTYTMPNEYRQGIIASEADPCLISYSHQGEILFMYGNVRDENNSAIWDWRYTSLKLDPDNNALFIEREGVKYKCALTRVSDT